MRRTLCSAIVFLGAAAPSVWAQKDKPGSSDHPLVSRYQGSIIKEQSKSDFDAYRLPLGQITNENMREFKKQLDVEGKITRTAYFGPTHSSALLVYRNYETALKQAGFQTMFSCALDDCNNHILRLVYFWTRFWGSGLTGGNSVDPDKAHILVAKLSRPSGVVYVTICSAPLYDDPYTFVDVIETKAMETGMVTVDAKALANDISQTGHAAVYGIYFDTGKSVLKPESDPTLAEIGKLLAANAQLKLHVIGNTDNMGTLTSNMTLSKQRADAVVAALVAKYRVAAGRLLASGIGPLAPVATNHTEDGRAKNRRVELVEQ